MKDSEVRKELKRAIAYIEQLHEQMHEASMKLYISNEMDIDHWRYVKKRLKGVKKSG